MSKRIWQHPDVPAGETTVSWRSVGQLEDTPVFRNWLEREFPQGAAEMSDESDAATSRRSFLKLMGASTALAGFSMAACRRPESYILPYAKAPEWVIPGKATYYASSMPRSSGAVPLVVKTYEGRPTLVSPNYLHLDASGTDAFTQASVLDLYSPSRSRTVLKGGKVSSRKEFEAAFSAIASNSSGKVAFVFGRDDSPTRSRLVKELSAKYASAKFYAYEALEGEAPKLLSGKGKLVANFEKADRVLSLDCDFAHLDVQGPVRPFFDRRKPEGAAYDKKADSASLNRLYVVESVFSMTGGMADHRLRVAPSQQLPIIAYIANKLGLSSLTAGITPVSDEKTISWLNPLIDDLKAHSGKSAVLVGSRLPQAAQLLVLAINDSLGNIGAGKPLKAVETDAQAYGDLAKLVKDLNAGSIETVFLLTPSNPVYDAPADLKFAEALAKAKTSIHLGFRTDATAQAATWHVPSTHYLETWADARSANGVYSVVQPMILPLYSACASEIEVLAALAGDGKLVTGEGEKGAAGPAYDAVRKTFTATAGASQEAWKKFLHDGFLADTSYALTAVGVGTQGCHRSCSCRDSGCGSCFLHGCFRL
jgi:MoCo/4Fe-4S cofactor protein with predicted Tat translocation signal